MPRPTCGAENAITSCDLRILVEEAAEPVASSDADVVVGRRDMGPAVGWSVVEGPVQPVGVVVIDVFAEPVVQMPSAGDEVTRPALAPRAGNSPLVSYLLPASLRCQAGSVAGVTGKISVQRLRGRSLSRASAANQARSAGSYRTRRACPAQHRVLVPEYQQLGILGPVAAEHQDGQAEYAARQQIDDPEQHPASQPSPRQAC